MNNQAAQTMHPDALQDGTLSKSTAKRVEALAASGGEAKPEPSPKQCRERLMREGKPYPRSGCDVCKTGGLTGCPYEKAVHAPDPPAAASVSERARALLAAEYERANFPDVARTIREGGYRWDSIRALELRAIEQALTQPLEISGDQVVLVGYKNADGEDCSAFLTASRIGQLLALTQQRGEDSDIPFATTQRVVRALLHLGHGVPEGQEEQYARSNELVLTLCSEVMSTTPQPSADAVRELVKRWREKAKHHEIKGDRADQPADTSEWHKGMDEGVSDCADELESMLSAASGEKGVG